MNLNLNYLSSKITKLKKSKLSKEITKKIKNFEKVSKSKKKIFSELCFCILTANFNAEKTIKIQKQLSYEFTTDSKQNLSLKLKLIGHRFPNTRADYIIEARKKQSSLFSLIQKYKNNEKILREEIVKKIKGLGMKETSHFLRNIGFKNLAIIDFHILDLLKRFNLISSEISLTKKNYLKIEFVLKQIADKLDLSLAELDFYLWFIETGKILK